MSDLAERIAKLTPEQRELFQRSLIDAQRISDIAPMIPPAPDRCHREPSSGEERLWFLDKLGGSSGLYNMSSALYLSGELNVDALRSTLRALVRRHEIFRTRYLSDAGALRIVVSAESEIGLAVRNVEDGAGGTGATLATALAEEAARPFLLDSDTLLRAVLYQRGPDDNVFQLTTHHIASDGWSQELLWHEFAECYNASLKGLEAELPKLTTQYADYAHWMRSPQKAAALAASAEQWAELLRGCSAVLELPTDHRRPSTQAHRGSTRSFVLPSNAANELLAFAGRESATPFMVLLAALFAVLRRYTGQTRILIGTPMAARTVPEIEGVIGFFANTVAIPGDLSGDPAFRQLVAQVRAVAVKAFGYQDVPFESLVQRLNPERDLSRSPLVQVMLALDDNASAEVQLDGLTTSRQMIHSGTSKFDLTIHAAVSPGAGSASVEFNSDVFEPETIDRFWSHLTNFLECAIARPADRVSTIPFLDTDERSMTLSAGNATEPTGD